MSSSKGQTDKEACCLSQLAPLSNENAVVYSMMPRDQQSTGTLPDECVHWKLALKLAP